ncbi:nucleotidyltransferase [Anaerovorax odorimutans]|uniref:nucleotidyltransferase n=1 Tax=Anaerovorax odorimutans TaxID=109327 RepID=UPI0004215DA5|nr:nucleotidyltransferase [Anaerovorax odorimutans]
MKVLGIISEYNPFHNGHLYHLEESKRITGAEYTVSVMSGDFTQRGEPAMADKWLRAKMAVNNGIDLVLELPFVYACNNAEYFAKGAIKILNGLGCITHLSFGSESGEIQDLMLISKEITNESEEYKKLLKEFLDLGLSYPKARENALAKCMDLETMEIIRKSNNILGIEYLKQLSLNESKIIPITIKRKGSDYSDLKMSKDLSSAMAIRRELEINFDFKKISEHIPLNTLKILEETTKIKVKMDDLYEVLSYQIVKNSKEELSEIFSVGEGLENRLKNQTEKSSNMQELIKNIKTKRYPFTRIQRLLIHTLFNLTKEEFFDIEKNGKIYGRVLGFNKNGAALLNCIKKRQLTKIPIITNINKETAKEESIQKILKYDIFSSNIYNLIGDGNLIKNSDFIKKPYIK